MAEASWAAAFEGTYEDEAWRKRPVLRFHHHMVLSGRIRSWLDSNPKHVICLLLHYITEKMRFLEKVSCVENKKGSLLSK